MDLTGPPEESPDSPTQPGDTAATPAPCDLPTAVIPRIDDEAFYRDSGLYPDSTRVLLEAPGIFPGEVMERIGEVTGLGAGYIRPYPVAGELRLYGWAKVGRPPSLAEARAAADALRKDEAFSFASLMFQSERGSDIVLVNRLVVQFSEAATPHEIACLNQSVGVAVEREPTEGGRTVWRLTFPRGAEPLSVARYYQLHPLTEWATVDKIHEWSW